MRKLLSSFFAMKKIPLILLIPLLIIASGTLFQAWAQPKELLADARPRTPEMEVDEASGNLSGPLLEIFDAAAKSLGYSVKWRAVPFVRSLAQMKNGDSDIVPRLVMTEERKEFAEFLGPIGVQPTEIEFLVKPGREKSLKSYEDIKKMSVGTKRGTAYFEKFDKDSSLRKVESLDDENLAKMLRAGRFDTMIVLDRPAIERVLKEHKISYAWADYKVPIRLGIYYGMSKSSKHSAIAKPLSEALRKMVKSGRVAEIYKKYHATPPPSN